MKKTLLGTTALVAAVIAGPAFASDPLNVTVSGNVVTGFYVIDADNINLGGPSVSFQDTKVALVARNIDIKAEGTLDNGLRAGVDAKLQLNNDYTLGNDLVGSSNVDPGSSFASFRQLFAYLEGGFGKFEIGGTDGAAYKMHYTSPWFVPGNGVDSPNILNVPLELVRHSTFSLLATDSNKVSYFTPRLAGFQLGLSFTPHVTRSPSENGLVLAPKDQGVDNVYEIALNYAGRLGAVDVGADAFYVKGSGDYLAGNLGDPKEYGAGLNLGYAGFTLGGAYYKSEDIYGNWGAVPSVLDFADRTWTAGLKYATGPWTVGVAYLDTDQDLGAFVGNTSKTSKNWHIGGGYNLGAGVDVGLDLQSTKFKLAGFDYDSKSAGLVLAIAF